VASPIDRNRLILIGCATLLMLAVVVVIGQSLYTDSEEALLTPGQRPRPTISVEAGVFERSSLGLLYKDRENIESKRTLGEYYSRRAYPGAPPVIPHEIFDEASFGGKGCLSCHANGDYVPRLKAYAPVTPHPEMASCRQCHVAGEKRDRALLVASTFSHESPPALHQAAMPGAPPPIPHALEMRNNCLACHGGPGAPREVRTTHPERSNCRQCHVTSGAVEEELAQ